MTQLDACGWVDLNLPRAGGAEDREEIYQERVAATSSLGYRHIASAYTLTAAVEELPKQFHDFTPRAPPMNSAASPQSQQSLLSRQRTAFVQHRRLTVVLNDTADTAALAASRAVHHYDVVAVQPLSDRAFVSACTLLDVDIIAVDCSRLLPFRWRVQHVREALRRGVHFELCYSHMLRDHSARRMMIANAVLLVRLTGGKGIVLSSGARSALDLRSPQDAANLATLLGMSLGAAREAMLGRGHAVLRHGEARRADGKYIIALPENKPPRSLSDKWPEAHRNESEGHQATRPADQQVTAATIDSDDGFMSF